MADLVQVQEWVETAIKSMDLEEYLQVVEIKSEDEPVEVRLTPATWEDQSTYLLQFNEIEDCEGAETLLRNTITRDLELSIEETFNQFYGYLLEKGYGGYFECVKDALWMVNELYIKASGEKAGFVIS